MTGNNQRRHHALLLKRFALCVFGWCVLATVAHGDLIKLHSGGELRGKFVKNRTNREIVTLETMNGAVVSVARVDTAFITMRPMLIEDYESRLRRLPDTLAAHLEIAEWCRQKGLSHQRETHLLQVVKLDPEHEASQQALGRVRHQGRWISRDDMMTQQGYVKYKGKYITAQELEVVEKTTAERQSERAWTQKIKGWINRVQGDTFASVEKQREAWQSLEAIHDADAAPAISNHLATHEHRDLRLLAVKVLSRLGGPKSVPGLVKLSLMDVDAEVRYAALQGFAEEQHERALPLYVKALRSEWNPVVCRAGTGLGVVGRTQAVPALIDALITPHNYQVRVPGNGNSNYTFSTNGGFTSGSALPPNIEAGLRAGQYPQGVIVLDQTPNAMLSKTRVVTVTMEHQNAEVLTALQKLTGKNFGYDKRTWHLWWAAEKNQGAKGPLKS